MLNRHLYDLKGIRAIHSPHTGIIDWGFVARHFGMMYQKHGGEIVLNFEAEEFIESENPNYPIRVRSTANVKTHFRVYPDFDNCFP